MNWHCPSCNASCRTPESLSIHVSHCRAMSVEDIEQLLFQAVEKWKLEPIPGRTGYGIMAQTVHAFHIKKLRGRKNL